MQEGNKIYKYGISILTHNIFFMQRDILFYLFTLIFRLNLSKLA